MWQSLFWEARNIHRCQGSYGPVLVPILLRSHQNLEELHSRFQTNPEIWNGPDCNLWLLRVLIINKYQISCLYIILPLPLPWGLVVYFEEYLPLGENRMKWDFLSPTRRSHLYRGVSWWVRGSQGGSLDGIFTIAMIFVYSSSLSSFFCPSLC